MAVICLGLNVLTFWTLLWKIEYLFFLYTVIFKICHSKFATELLHFTVFHSICSQNKNRESLYNFLMLHIWLLVLYSLIIDFCITCNTYQYPAVGQQKHPMQVYSSGGDYVFNNK